MSLTGAEGVRRRQSRGRFMSSKKKQSEQNRNQNRETRKKSTLVAIGTYIIGAGLSIFLLLVFKWSQRLSIAIQGACYLIELISRKMTLI